MTQNDLESILWYRRAKFLDQEYLDGDSIWVMIDRGHRDFSERLIRIKGINAPELRAKDAAVQADALDAKYFLRQLLKSQGEWIYLKSEKSDGRGKYGRFIYDVFIFNDENGSKFVDKKNRPKTRLLSEIMIERGYAEEYK